MSLPLLSAEVLSVRQLTHDVREVTFHLREPAQVTFAAGQYVYLTVPPLAPGQPGTKRAYSLCSSPTARSHLSLLANLVPGGPGSTYFFSLTKGDPVMLSGPTGQFVLDDATTRDYCFIATGTGIAPLRSMLLGLASRRERRPITLLWGLRSERDLYYQEEFAALTTQCPQFRLITTLSQPQSDWSGPHGRVTQILPDLCPSVQNLDVYLCGSQAMIQDVKAVLRTKGLCPIHTEKFY